MERCRKQIIISILCCFATEQSSDTDSVFARLAQLRLRNGTHIYFMQVQVTPSHGMLPYTVIRSFYTIYTCIKALCMKMYILCHNYVIPIYRQIQCDISIQHRQYCAHWLQSNYHLFPTPCHRVSRYAYMLCVQYYVRMLCSMVFHGRLVLQDIN